MVKGIMGKKKNNAGVVQRQALNQGRRDGAEEASYSMVSKGENTWKVILQRKLRSVMRLIFFCRYVSLSFLQKSRRPGRWDMWIFFLYIVTDISLNINK